MNIWKAGNDVTDLVAKRIDKAHQEITELKQGGIIVLMTEKAKEKDGRVEYGTIAKAPKLLPLLTDKKYEYKFVITIGADHWDRLNDEQRVALIDHFLCGITCKYDEKNETVTYVLKPPDIQMYTREIEHHGIWMPDSDALDRVFTKWYAPVSGGTPVVRSSSASPASPITPAVSAPPASPAANVRMPPKKATKVQSGKKAPEQKEEEDDDDPIQAWIQGSEESDAPSMN